MIWQYWIWVWFSIMMYLKVFQEATSPTRLLGPGNPCPCYFAAAPVPPASASPGLLLFQSCKTWNSTASASVKCASLRFVSFQSQGCWLALSLPSIPLCLLPQHCLACLEGPCSKALARLQSLQVLKCGMCQPEVGVHYGHQGHGQGPVAQCQCLVTSTYMCGISTFTSTEPKN